MSKVKFAATGEQYALVALDCLSKNNYPMALGTADFAYFLGASSVALVWCKYHHDKIISGDTEGGRIPFFLTAYKLSEYFEIPGYLEYQELASAMWSAAKDLQSAITGRVMVHVKNLQESAKKYAGIKVTVPEALKLTETMDKPYESIFLPKGSTKGTTESTHLLKDVSGDHYGNGSSSSHHQDEVPVAGKQSIISKFFSCCFGGSGEE